MKSCVNGYKTMETLGDVVICRLSIEE